MLKFYSSPMAKTPTLSPALIMPSISLILLTKTKRILSVLKLKYYSMTCITTPINVPKLSIILWKQYRLSPISLLVKSISKRLQLCSMSMKGYWYVRWHKCEKNISKRNRKRRLLIMHAIIPNLCRITATLFP